MAIVNLNGFSGAVYADCFARRARMLYRWHWAAREGEHRFNEYSGSSGHHREVCN